MPEISDEDILLFINENQPVRAHQLEERFVNEKNIARISRGSLYNRLRDFRELDRIEKTLDQVTSRPVYSISSKEIPHLEQIKREKDWLNYYRKMSQTEGLFLREGVALVNPIQVKGTSPDKKIIIDAIADIPTSETKDSQKEKLDRVTQSLMYQYNNNRDFFHSLNKISNQCAITIRWDP
jgi:hypothetical protein